MIELTREVAFRIAEGTIQSQTDARYGEQEPELVILERSRPDQAALTRTIRDFLTAQIGNCAKRRRDEEAMKGLAEALQMAARLLTPLEVREGEGGGPASSMRRTMLGLAAQILGEMLPDPVSMRRIAG